LGICFSLFLFSYRSPLGAEEPLLQNIYTLR
jgi:hypothetical protein